MFLFPKRANATTKQKEQNNKKQCHTRESKPGPQVPQSCMLRPRHRDILTY